MQLGEHYLICKDGGIEYANYNFNKMELNIQPNLFLGITELRHLQDSLGKEGFKNLIKQSTATYGIISNKQNESLPFNVSEGSVSGSILVSEGSAFDSNGEFLSSKQKNIEIPNDNTWYWVKVKYTQVVKELGTVSIDSQGNLTGVDTKFSKLRSGQQGSIISFIGSSNNSEYLVQEVSSDTEAVLGGQFTPETNLEYRIVGTFTPSFVPTSDQKYPFKYDSVNFELIQESVLNTRPAYVSGLEFFVARVKNDSGNLEIQDKRKDWFQSNAEFLSSFIFPDSIDLFGIEAVKFDDDKTPRDSNILEVSWAFKSESWTYNTSLRKVSISSGKGGSYKDSSFFTNGDFDGFRLYINGKRHNILQSQLNGSDIDVFLQSLNPDDFSQGGELRIVPDCDYINVFCRSEPTDGNKLVSRVGTFNVSLGTGKLFLTAYKSPTSLYNVKYSYTTGGYNSPEYSPVSSSYYNEEQFDSNGNLIASPTLTNYTADSVNGFIPINENNNSFRKEFDRVSLGDLLGVERKTLDNSNPVITLKVGESAQHLVIEGSANLTTNHFIALSNVGAVPGNIFYIDIEASLTLNGNFLSINQDFIDAVNSGIILKKLTPTDVNYIKLPRAEGVSDNRKISVKCYFDGTQWESVVLEEDKWALNDIRFLSGNESSKFTNGIGVKDEFIGWAIADGRNGTQDLRSRFIVTMDDRVSDPNGNFWSSEYNTVGNTGGEKEHTLSITEMPNHSHSYKKVVDDGTGTSLNDSGNDAFENKPQSDTQTESAGGGLAHENRPPFVVLFAIQRI